jgi:glycosyltransferase involved in cell wall biosynthesis
VRILLLAYYFPPLGGAGGQRNAKVARYLPELGYELTVVTGPGSPDYRWTPIDDDLTGKVAAGVGVHRLRSPEPPRSDGWRFRGERWLGLRSPWERWWYEGAVQLGREVGTEADVIYASLNPYPTARAARALGRELGKPLVVDLEDPWAFDEMMIYPTAVHRRLELARMRRALAPAAAVVMNTPEAAKRVSVRFPEVRRKPVVSIPNGFDSEDFGEPPAERADGKFRIVHTGSLHTDLGRRHRQFARLRRALGGAVRGVELLTRSHVYLLEAVEALIEEEPELASTIEIHLAGSLTGADTEVLQRSSVVRAHGFLPHSETVRLMQSADLLFLPLHDVPVGRRVSIVPCKTYEYLASGRPILAAVPDGDARDLLAEAGNAFLCRPADIGAMRDIIRDQLRRARAGAPVAGPDPSVLARLEPQQLMRELASLLEHVAGGRRPAAQRSAVVEPAA